MSGYVYVDVVYALRFLVPVMRVTGHLKIEMYEF